MSFVEDSGVVDFSNEGEREKFIEGLSKLLEDSVIRSMERGKTRVIFHINRKVKDTYFDSDIFLNNIDLFLFRRFETGLIRKGLDNLSRLILKPLDGCVEHISSISYWKHNVSGLEGIQIILYSGKMLRFLGKTLKIDIDDGNEIENEFITPKKIETSLTKIIYHSDRIIMQSRVLVNKIKKVDVKYNREVDANKKSAMQMQIEDEGKIDGLDEFEDNIDQETDEMTEEQKNKAKEILNQISKNNEDIQGKEPKNYYEIYKFESDKS